MEFDQLGVCLAGDQGHDIGGVLGKKVKGVVPKFNISTRVIIIKNVTVTTNNSINYQIYLKVYLFISIDSFGVCLRLPR